MFTSTPELDAAVPADRAEEVYRRVYAWFGEHGESIADGGAELQPVTTATTVTHGSDGPVVADGPFSEAKEVVGGFSVLDVPDLDAAVSLLVAWVAELASAERIDRQLLATRDDVKALVHGRPSRLDEGWRSQLAGAGLHRLLSGEAVIRLADGGRRLRME